MKISVEHIRNRASAVTGMCAAIVACLIAVSCSTTKRIPDDEQLYIGVKKIDIQEISDISEIRITLETLAVKLAHQRMTPEGLKKLKKEYKK